MANKSKDKIEKKVRKKNIVLARSILILNTIYIYKGDAILSNFTRKLMTAYTCCVSIVYNSYLVLNFVRSTCCARFSFFLNSILSIKQRNIRKYLIDIDRLCQIWVSTVLSFCLNFTV